MNLFGGLAYLMKSGEETGESDWVIVRDWASLPLPLTCDPENYDIGAARPLCAGRLPSHISNTVEPTVSGGGLAYASLRQRKPRLPSLARPEPCPSERTLPLQQFPV